MFIKITFFLTINFRSIVVECLGPGPGGGHGFRFGELQSRTQHTPTTQLPIVIVLAMKQLLPTSTSQYR